jgi:hypothetical protein
MKMDKLTIRRSSEMTCFREIGHRIARLTRVSCLTLILALEATVWSASPNHELKVRDVYLRLEGNSLVAVTDDGKPLSANPITIIQGDVVEVDLVQIGTFDPTSEIELATWKYTWEYHSGGFLGIGGTDHKDDVFAHVKRRLGTGGNMNVSVQLPGADKYEVQPKSGKQGGILALRSGQLVIAGATGDLTPPGDYGKTDRRAKRTGRTQTFSAEGKNILHFRVYVKRATIKDITDQ